MENNLRIKPTDTGWNALYIVGGISALIAVIFFRRNIGAELSAFKGFGIFRVPDEIPVRAVDWFTLLQENPVVGLAFLNMFDIINYALVGLILLALYTALRNTCKSAMLIATTCGLIGVAVFFASNQALEMLFLSDRYTAAVDETQRILFLAAGESLLIANNPGTFYPGTGEALGLLLVLLAGLIISLVMWRSHNFGKVTAVFGILANGFGLLYFPAMVLALAIYWLPPTVSAPFRMIWYVLIAVKLFQLAKTK